MFCYPPLRCKKVSSAPARRPRYSAAGHCEGGLFSISRAWRNPCAPPSPVQSVLVCSGVSLPLAFFGAFPFPWPSAMGSGVRALGMLGVKCSSREGKWGRLVVYIDLHDPNFVCLQELLVDLDPATPMVPPYRVLSGDTFRGAGVAVLGHMRRAGRATIQVGKERHALGVGGKPETTQ